MLSDVFSRDHFQASFRAITEQALTGLRKATEWFDLVGGKYKLTSYVALSCALFLLPILSVCGYLQWSEMKSRLFVAETNHLVRMAKILSSDIWQRHSIYIMGAEGYSPEELRAGSETRRIHEELKDLTAAHGILKIKIYSPSGYAIYSSDHQQIGQSKSDNTRFGKVVGSGKSNSKSSYRETFTGFEVYKNVHVVETYVPIFDTSGDIISVVEVYSNVTDAIERITWISLKVAGVYACGFLALFVGLIWIVFRADQELMRQSDDLKRAHDKLHLTNAELEENITALKDAQQQIVEKGKMAQLGQLTATVAHEIRNPLGSVRTAAFLVQRKIDVAELGVAKQFERIESGVKRCDNIISQLLSFARRDNLHAEDVALNDWVQSVIGSERENIPAIVEIRQELEFDGGNVSFDADQMRRVLVNLINNASEAMVGKTGEDRAVETPLITVSTRCIDGNIEIAVEDNGPGITPENLAKIRQPLFTTKSFGVGLGIPAVEKILQLHSGGLRIETNVGHGTSMTAWFPFAIGVGEADKS